MPIDKLFIVYVSLTLGGVAILALYSAQRQRRFGPQPSNDRIFRCEKCGFVYTDDPDVDRSRCTHCGILNEAIRF